VRREMPPDRSGLSRGEWCMLARLAEQPAHGGGLVRDLDPQTRIGQVWAANEQRIYRALRRLHNSGFIEPVPDGRPDARVADPARSTGRLRRVSACHVQSETEDIAVS